MTALAQERPETMPDTRTESVTELAEALWQAWKTMQLPEGFHAEIIEGFIEVSPTGRLSHAQISGRLRRSLNKFLDEAYAAHNDANVMHGRKVWIPDAFVAPEDLESHSADGEGLGVNASAVQLVVEVTSPGRRNLDRDRVRKRREYARAGIPVYVIIDDYDKHGTVTVLTGPLPEKADWEGEHRVPYGTEVTITEGPAKGFVITEAITGPSRA